MNVCIPSIRHSGTRLLLKKIFKGWKATNPLHPDFKSGNYMIAGHVYPPSLEYVRKYIKDMPAVVPMRHPAAVWRSFSDRDMSYDFYFDHWMNMIEHIDIYDPMYIHIDLPNRRDYDLGGVETRLGIKLNHDWTIDDTVSDKGNANMAIGEYDEMKIPKVIMDYYNRTLK